MSEPISNKPKAEAWSTSFNASAASEARQKRRRILISLAFLCAIVVLSLAWYQTGLGFYQDDWKFLAYLHNSRDQSLSGLFHSLNLDRNIRARPVQAGTLVLLYKLFHLSPIGYHIFNAVVLVAIALLLFLLLLELDQSVLLSGSIAALYILLPNYSTDRFWVAAFQTNVSIAFYLLSFYADLKSLRRSRLWKVVSLTSVALSIFAYEVTIPLFAVNLAAVLWKGRASRKARWMASLTAIAVVLCVIGKAFITERPVLMPHSWLHHLSWLCQRAFFVNFVQYGLALPHVVFKILHNHLHLGALIVSILTGLLVASFLVFLAWKSSGPISRTKWKNLMGGGLVVFTLGYAIFLITVQIGFSKTGDTNRTAIAAALGVAVCYVGIIGWVSSFFGRSHKYVFCALLATLCTAETLINNAIAYYWTTGYKKELAVQRSIFRSFPSLHPEKTLIVDGVCAYYGPAIVLIARLDVSGVLQLHYRHPRLAGDVISPRIRVSKGGLVTSIWDAKHFYPYSPNLLIYNVQLQRKFVMRNPGALEEYFSTYRPETNLNCPGYPGQGVAPF